MSVLTQIYNERPTITAVIGERFTGGDESAELLMWVDKGGDNANDGRSQFRPVRDIEAAIDKAASIIGTEPSWAANPITGGHVIVNPSSDAHPHEIPCLLEMPPNLTISSRSDALRSAWVKPSAGNASKNGFLMNSGCRLQGLSFKGWTLDPPIYSVLSGDINAAMTGFVASFLPGATITRSPAIHDCTHHSPNGGGLHANAAVLNAASLSRLFTTDAFTQVLSGGLSYLIDDDAYVEIVSGFSYAAQAHVLARRGGACNMTNSNTGFGGYCFIADGYRLVTYPAGYRLPGNLYANGTVTLSVNGADQVFTAGQIIPRGALVKTGGATLRRGSFCLTTSHNLEWLNGSVDGADDGWAAYPPEQGGTGGPTNPERIGVGSNHGVVIGSFTDEAGETRTVNRTSTAAFSVAKDAQAGNVADEIVIGADGTIRGRKFQQSILAQITPFLFGLADN